MDDDEEVFGEGEAYEEEPTDEELLFIDEEIAQCFAVFDHKRTGLMPTKHLDKALRSLGILLTSFEIEDLIDTYEKDGYIEFGNFRDFALDKIREAEPYQDLKQCFAVFDPEGEGVIPTDRLKKWMMTLGDPLTEAEAKDFCKMGDPSNKGVFAYDDVVPQLLF